MSSRVSVTVSAVELRSLDDEKLISAGRNDSDNFDDDEVSGGGFTKVAV